MEVFREDTIVKHDTCYYFMTLPVINIILFFELRIRAAFVLGQSASARVSTFQVASCMALPLTDYEPEVCF